MIAVRLMGGLGNQMFQYALARRLSLDRDTKVLIDLSHLENQPVNETPRHYELDCFNIKARLSNDPVPTEQQPRKYFIKKKHFKPFYEQGFPFKKEVFDLPDQTLLIGYWQTEKYFKKYRDQIHKDFTFNKPLPMSKYRLMQEIQASSTAVSLQIRRGDYIFNPQSQKFHGLVNMSYYNRAVEYIAKRIKNPIFYVVSDDPEWCRQNIKLNYPTVFVAKKPGPGWEDMLLMSRCKHQIIANSSFGWWAAWLNNHKNKIVIAPKTWAKEKTADYSDLVPKNWIRF